MMIEEKMSKNFTDFLQRHDLTMEEVLDVGRKVLDLAIYSPTLGLKNPEQIILAISGLCGIGLVELGAFNYFGERL